MENRKKLEHWRAYLKTESKAPVTVKKNEKEVASQHGIWNFSPNVDPNGLT